jgi:hypothetical protein
MVDNQSALIVEVVEQDNVGFHGAFYFDLMETLLKRLVFALANELGRHGVTAVAVNPGFMRTEAMLDGFGVTDANWRDALKNPQAAGMGWGGSESPCFVGRAVAALAADPNVGRKKAASTRPVRCRRNTDSATSPARVRITQCLTPLSRWPRPRSLLQ